MEAFVLYPHQLFRDNPDRVRGRRVFLVEDELFFRQYAFHQQKLVLHRASMRTHAEYLAGRGAQVQIVETLAPMLAAQPEAVHYIDPVDDWLERRLARALGEAGAAAIRHDTPMFLTPSGALAEEFAGRGPVRMQHFYARQRRALGVLMDGKHPRGGRWSFDSDNRKPLPKGLAAPPLHRPLRDAHVRDAIAHVEKAFSGNPGRAADFAYPTTYAGAQRWLKDFLEHRFARFGDYEDAMAAGQPHLFHSVLSPLLNIGLLTPREVLDAALACKGVPLNSLEGFVRQLIGWREFMRGAYVHRGRRQRTRNHWGHERPLPASFWRGETGLAPLDIVIRRVLEHAYAHHIERLMVLGNFMLLAGYRPDDCYRWFMEMFIDAYDWVMVPNVYGMALHADGGLITTKPYISGSSYLRRMSDFPPGEWRATWDGLYWRFIHEHREFFESNPRLGVVVRALERMAPAARRSRLQRAERFLAH